MREDSKVSPEWGYCNMASVFFAMADAQMLALWLSGQVHDFTPFLNTRTPWHSTHY